MVSQHQPGFLIKFEFMGSWESLKYFEGGNEVFLFRFIFFL
jgi:hypothetical protein